LWKWAAQSPAQPNSPTQHENKSQAKAFALAGRVQALLPLFLKPSSPTGPAVTQAPASSGCSGCPAGGGRGSVRGVIRPGPSAAARNVGLISATQPNHAHDPLQRGSGGKTLFGRVGVHWVGAVRASAGARGQTNEWFASMGFDQQQPRRGSPCAWPRLTHLIATSLPVPCGTHCRLGHMAGHRAGSTSRFAGEQAC
jgi:hypothetical protein